MRLRFKKIRLEFQPIEKATMSNIPGLHLGSILSSVSPAVVVPTAMAFNSKGFGTKKKIALLVANAGGLDTAFTEGMFGVINSAIFYPSPPAYRIIKVFLSF